jgi:hypothetical protein
LVSFLQPTVFSVLVSYLPALNHLSLGQRLVTDYTALYESFEKLLSMNILSIPSP